VPGQVAARPIAEAARITRRVVTPFIVIDEVVSRTQEVDLCAVGEVC